MTGWEGFRSCTGIQDQHGKIPGRDLSITGYGIKSNSSEPVQGPVSSFPDISPDSKAKMQDSMASPGLRPEHVFTPENSSFSDDRIVWDSMDGG